MKSTELKNYTIQELHKLLDEKRIELAKMKIDLKRGKTNAVHSLKNLQAEVARILTELNIRRITK